MSACNTSPRGPLKDASLPSRRPTPPRRSLRASTPRACGGPPCGSCGQLVLRHRDRCQTKRIIGLAGQGTSVPNTLYTPSMHEGLVESPVLNAYQVTQNLQSLDGRELRHRLGAAYDAKRIKLGKNILKVEQSGTSRNKPPTVTGDHPRHPGTHSWRRNGPERPGTVSLTRPRAQQ